MRLTSLRLEDFRRFEDLKLEPIDPSLTFVVTAKESPRCSLRKE